MHRFASTTVAAPALETLLSVLVVVKSFQQVVHIILRELHVHCS